MPGWLHRCRKLAGQGRNTREVCSLTFKCVLGVPKRAVGSGGHGIRAPPDSAPGTHRQKAAAMRHVTGCFSCRPWKAALLHRAWHRAPPVLLVNDDTELMLVTSCVTPCPLCGVGFVLPAINIPGAPCSWSRWNQLPIHPAHCLPRPVAKTHFWLT